MGKKARVATCPSCHKERDPDGQKRLRATEATWFRLESQRVPRDSAFFPLEDGMRCLAVEGRDDWYWACDRCLDTGKALAADPAKQVLGIGTPFAAYVDRPFRCDECGAQSRFSPEEQQLWYEKLSFLIWVHPKQCKPCRAARRKRKAANRALAEALACLDQKNPDQLDGVAALYDDLGRPARAAEFRARAKNLRRR